MRSVGVLLAFVFVESGCGSASVEESSPSVAVPVPIPVVTASATAPPIAAVTASASAAPEPPALPPIDAKLTELHGVVTQITTPSLTGDNLVLDSGQKADLGFHGPIAQMRGKRVVVTGEFKFLHGRVSDAPAFLVKTMKLEGDDATAEILEIGPEEDVIGTVVRVKASPNQPSAPDRWQVVTAKGKFEVHYLMLEPALDHGMRVTIRRLTLAPSVHPGAGVHVAVTDIEPPDTKRQP